MYHDVIHRIKKKQSLTLWSKCFQIDVFVVFTVVVFVLYFLKKQKNSKNNKAPFFLQVIILLEIVLKKWSVKQKSDMTKKI